MTRKYSLECITFVLLAAALLSAQATSSWVFVGSDGHLHYKTDSQGNRIMDFSSAGYKAGGVPLPVVATQRTVNPSGGDDTTGKGTPPALDRKSTRLNSSHT